MRRANGAWMATASSNAAPHASQIRIDMSPPPPMTVSGGEDCVCREIFAGRCRPAERLRQADRAVDVPGGGGDGHGRADESGRAEPGAEAVAPEPDRLHPAVRGERALRA